MLEVREIPEKESARAAAAMLALRPRWQTPAALIDFIDNSLRPTGYRLIGAFEDEQGDALAVAGFREVHALAWGHYLYVDDVSTLAGARGRGCGERLMDWLIEEAAGLDCEGLHLDSGDAADRAPASALYAPQAAHLSSPLRALDLAALRPALVRRSALPGWQVATASEFAALLLTSPRQPLPNLPSSPLTRHGCRWLKSIPTDDPGHACRGRCVSGSRRTCFSAVVSAGWGESSGLRGLAACRGTAPPCRPSRSCRAPRRLQPLRGVGRYAPSTAARSVSPADRRRRPT